MFSFVAIQNTYLIKSTVLLPYYPRKSHICKAVASPMGLPLMLSPHIHISITCHQTGKIGIRKLSLLLESRRAWKISVKVLNVTWKTILEQLVPARMFYISKFPALFSMQSRLEKIVGKFEFEIKTCRNKSF